ncbi:hypothetical protein VNO78_06458 [Psophocarpus tetragonolobus]|uniref:Uncharacterized protein n=1 Tax=Psophocarpus tetragonolobus TaxID=3891 RepID=A0AAN9T1M5_PSOTE
MAAEYRRSARSSAEAQDPTGSGRGSRRDLYRDLGSHSRRDLRPSQEELFGGYWKPSPVEETGRPKGEVYEVGSRLSRFDVEEEGEGSHSVQAGLKCNSMQKQEDRAARQ